MTGEEEFQPREEAWPYRTRPASAGPRCESVSWHAATRLPSPMLKLLADENFSGAIVRESVDGDRIWTSSGFRMLAFAEWTIRICSNGLPTRAGCWLRTASGRLPPLHITGSEPDKACLEWLRSASRCR